MKIPIAIFASGKGSNADAIIRFSQSPSAVYRVALVITNVPDAGVRGVCHQQGIPCFHWKNNDPLLPDFLMQNKVSFILLAGYMVRIGASLLEAYPHRILNIHPALLPQYGGKGMYGMHVHQAVIAAGEAFSGITIHEVDEEYDHGKKVFSAEIPVLPNDTPESLAQRIHALEHLHYPEVANAYIAAFGK
ncbi:MAG: phosphoribosylglycinamide formyltransferase [Bacteroidota bacterium]